MNSAPLPVNNFPSETLDSRRSDYGPGSDRGVQEKDYGYDKQGLWSWSSYIYGHCILTLHMLDMLPWSESVQCTHGSYIVAV